MMLNLLSIFLLIYKVAENSIAAEWVKFGDGIEGRDAGNKLGSAVDMSSDGSTIAVGSSEFDDLSGLVEMYTRNNVNQTWTLRGQGIEGYIGDRFGSSVALSTDGNVFVSGGRFNSENAYNSGKIGVFMFDDTADKWIQRGDDIYGERNDRSGSVVAISSDGSIVVTGSPWNNDKRGAVRVYKFNNTSWIQHGTDIVGENENDRVGSGSFSSLAISSDGTILAVGAWLNDGEDADSEDTNSMTKDIGNLRVFVFDGTDWKQRGSTMYGAKPGDNFGRVVSMSADGSIVASSLMHNEDGGSKSGSVQVFTFVGIIDDWIQLGSHINSAVSNDTQANSLAMSSDGTVLAIGAKDNNVENDQEKQSGNVRVFVYGNKGWIQRGPDINGEADGDKFGNALSISSNGCILAIGALLHDGVNGEDSGHVRVVESDSCVSMQPSMTPSVSPTIRPDETPSISRTIPPRDETPSVSPTIRPPDETTKWLWLWLGLGIGLGFWFIRVKALCCIIFLKKYANKDDS